MTNIQLAIKALGESAWYQRGEMDAESLMNVLSCVANTHETLLAAIEAKQAQIDALMLEFCPAEMTATQKMEWARRQKVSANSIAHAAPADAERLAEALQPFANLLQPHHASIPDDRPIYGINKAEITAGDLRRANEALTAHSAQAQPPAVSVSDWTDAQCVAFMAVGLRHTEYKKGKSPTVEEIRQGAKAALAAQENPNG